MPQYDDEGRIALFINDKRGNDRAPDLSGYAQIDGKRYRLSAWKMSKGKLVLSGQIEHEQRRDVPAGQPEFDKMIPAQQDDYDPDSPDFKW